MGWLSGHGGYCWGGVADRPGRGGAVIKIELLYFDGCPNWTVADERLAEAVKVAAREDLTLHWRKVETAQDAAAVGFTGSPTFLIDGRDPFASGDEQVGLACRVYSTLQGPAGSPSLEQLVEVLL